MSYRRHLMMADVGIKQVQYIEANGIDDIYLEIPIYPIQATDALEIMFRPIGTPEKQTRYVYSPSIHIYVNANYFLAYTAGTSPSYLNTPQAVDENHIYAVTLDYVNKTISSYRYNEDIPNLKTTNITQTLKTTQDSDPIRLLKAGSIWASVALYSFKYYRNGELIFDGIPVRVGKIGYLYDKISGTLFGSTGNDAFKYGPNKTT